MSLQVAFAPLRAFFVVVAGYAVAEFVAADFLFSALCRRKAFYAPVIVAELPLPAVSISIAAAVVRIVTESAFAVIVLRACTIC